MRIMGLDIGSKRIGVAISDESAKIASGLSVIKRRPQLEDDINMITELIKRHNVKEIVVGLPLNMDGSQGTQAEGVNLFIENLKSHTDIPVASWDERLTTLQGEKILIEADLSRKKRKEHIDKLSAHLILQGFLDYKTRCAELR